MSLSSAENSLINQYQDKIVPIENGYAEIMSFLCEHFTLTERALDEKTIQEYINCLKRQYPQKESFSSVKVFSIQRDTYSEQYFLSGILPGKTKENELLVVLDDKMGCLDCTNHRLRLELDIRKTITKQDIEEKNDIFRYRVFCFSELAANNW